MERGKYIVIEGGEGCGKTTQTRDLWSYLLTQNIHCVNLREPGSVEVAEKIREILLNDKHDIDPITELFLFEAARTEFFKDALIPHLEGGVWIVSDRSGYSTEAYQGYAGGLDLGLIRELNKRATFGIEPDLTFIIDVPSSKGLEKEVSKDRFAKKGPEYHARVNQGYLEIAKRDSNIVLIPYLEGDAGGMQAEIRNYVNERLNLTPLQNLKCRL